ncbi:MAG: UUP1 family membrane protein [Thermodesulfobacteriota bacterium]
MKRPGFLPAAVLFLVTCLLILYRIWWLGYPVLPVAKGQTWQLMASLFVTPHQEQGLLSLALPSDYIGNMVVEERVLSGKYAFYIRTEGPNRFGVWSGEDIDRPEELTYRAMIHSLPRRSAAVQSPLLGPYPSALSADEKTLTEAVTRKWQALPQTPRFQAVAGALKGDWGDSPPEGEAQRRWRMVQQKLDRADAALALFRASNLPARLVEGLQLMEGVQSLPIKWIDVWAGGSWNHLNPETGEVYPPDVSLLPLAVGGLPAIEISGLELSDLRWSLRRQVVSQWKLFYEHITNSSHFLDRWSLLQLPPEFQGTFRILLLVPIGALIISALRNVVGLPTFGIFMPLLIALAFRSTGTLYGVAIFCGVLLVGYGARFFLDKLHLLLVPRLSVILTLVVACFTLLALMGNKLGMRELMAVGLVPFVILTMTIERFFILIEESGVGAAARTALGSVAVSVIAYGLISWEPLQFTFFIYPELLLTVAALQILLGRYTGYRLSELYRFQSLRKSS